MDREQTTIRLPADLKEQIQKAADEMGIGFNALVLSIISDWLNQKL